MKLHFKPQFKPKLSKYLSLISLVLIAFIICGNILFSSSHVMATNIDLNSVNLSKNIQQSEILISQNQEDSILEEKIKVFEESIVEEGSDNLARVYFKKVFDGYGFNNLFIIFLVTLGPIKIIPVFVKITENADKKLSHKLALDSFKISTTVIIAVVFTSRHILQTWQVGIPSIIIATGVLLFLISLEILMSQYHQHELIEIPDEPSEKLIIHPLVLN